MTINIKENQKRIHNGTNEIFTVLKILDKSCLTTLSGMFIPIKQIEEISEVYDETVRS